MTSRFPLKPEFFCSLLGRNGSGKTTLLHCLNGIHRPYKGEIFINNRNIAGMSRNEIARHISLVPQEHLEIFPFRVLDVVVMGRAPFIGMTRTPTPMDYELALKALGNAQCPATGRLQFQPDFRRRKTNCPAGLRPRPDQ